MESSDSKIEEPLQDHNGSWVPNHRHTEVVYSEQCQHKGPASVSLKKDISWDLYTQQEIWLNMWSCMKLPIFFAGEQGSGVMFFGIWRKNCQFCNQNCDENIGFGVKSVKSWSSGMFIWGWCSSGDGSKPWYLVNPKIAGKWMFIPLKMYL